MKVKCINNSPWEDRLTIGKIYEVLREFSAPDGDLYTVIHDMGYKQAYFSHRFTLVKEKKMNPETVELNTKAKRSNKPKPFYTILRKKDNGDLTALACGLVVYSDEDEAYAEAKRHATNYPNNQYIVVRSTMAVTMVPKFEPNEVNFA